MDTPENLRHERHQLLLTVRMSIRYHNARRGFFDAIGSTTTATSLLFSSAAIGTLLSNLGDVYVAVTAGFVTLVSTVDLVVRSREKARLHHDLAREFAHLERKINENPQPDAECLATLENERLRLQENELPVKKVLARKMYNEILEREGYDREFFYKIGFLQSLFAQWFDLFPHRVRTYGEIEASRRTPPEIGNGAQQPSTSV